MLETYCSFGYEDEGHSSVLLCFGTYGDNPVELYADAKEKFLAATGREHNLVIVHPTVIEAMRAVAGEEVTVEGSKGCTAWHLWLGFRRSKDESKTGR